MRTYHPDYTKWGISRERYNELRAFCRQYPEWKAAAASLLGVGAQSYSAGSRGSDVPDPVARLVEKREITLRKIDTVERVARMVDNGRWYAVIIQNVCMGRALDYIDAALMPTSHRQEYFRRRREFFILLDTELLR